MSAWEAAEGAGDGSGGNTGSAEGGGAQTAVFKRLKLASMHNDTLRCLDALFVAAQHDNSALAADLFAVGATCRAARIEESFWSALVRAHVGPEQRTALMYAAFSDDAPRVRWILGRGQPLELLAARDVAGRTALHWAASGGSAAATHALLESGADVNVWSDPDAALGEQPIHEAAGTLMGAGAFVTQLLLDAGADVDAVENEGEPGCGHTPLHMAAMSGCTDTARILIAAGADLDFLNENHDPPLYICAWNGSYETLRVLLEAGASISAGDHSPLGVAVRYCRGDEAALLLEAGYDVNEIDADGLTALDHVGSGQFGTPSTGDRAPIIALLLRHGASTGAELMHVEEADVRK